MSVTRGNTEPFGQKRRSDCSDALRSAVNRLLAFLRESAVNRLLAFLLTDPWQRHRVTADGTLQPFPAIRRGHRGRIRGRDVLPSDYSCGVNSMRFNEDQKGIIWSAIAVVLFFIYMCAEFVTEVMS